MCMIDYYDIIGSLCERSGNTHDIMCERRIPVWVSSCEILSWMLRGAINGYRNNQYAVEMRARVNLQIP